MSKAAIKKARAERLNAALDKLAAQFPDGGQLWLSTSPETLFEQAAEEIARLRADHVPAPPPVSEQGAERAELPGFECGKSIMKLKADLYFCGAAEVWRWEGETVWFWTREGEDECPIERVKSSAVQAAAYALGYTITMPEYYKFGWHIGTTFAPYPLRSADDAALAALHHAQHRAVPRGAGGGEGRS